MKLRVLLIFTLHLFVFLLIPGLSEGVPEEEGLAGQMERDAAALHQSRRGLGTIIAFMTAHPELFPEKPAEEARFLNRSQRMALWETWQAFLDHMVALDLMGQRYSFLQKHRKDVPRQRLFFLTYGIFLAEYRYALDFIQIVEADPDLHTLLNEPVPELGLPGGLYSDLKFDFLNVIKGIEFAWMDLAYRYYGDPPDPVLAGGIEQDRRRIWEAGGGSGPSLTLKNGLKIVEDFGFKTWLPVQAHVARWMGDVKVLRQHSSLITRKQIEAMLPLLRPGDVLLTRQEWYLSNIGLPGFWPHAALYIGTPGERERYLGRDKGVRDWVRGQGVYSGDLEVLLKILCREPYLQSTRSGKAGAMPRIVEARSEGVCLSPVESTAAVDSLAVLRPMVSKSAKARAILRAFHYCGRPYDFNFDFLTDSELVCTELVYKAYEPGGHLAGLNLPLRHILGRSVMTANDIARVFDMDYGREKERFRLVLFLDGNETDRLAYLSDASRFRETWKRPKWHILVTPGRRD